LDGDTLLLRFPGADAAGEDDVAEQQLALGAASNCPTSSGSTIGKERTLVGLSFPRHSRFKAWTSSSPVNLIEISMARSLSSAPGKSLASTAASTARSARAGQPPLLSHSPDTSDST